MRRRGEGAVRGDVAPGACEGREGTLSAGGHRPPTSPASTGKVDLTGQPSAHRNVTDNCPVGQGRDSATGRRRGRVRQNREAPLRSDAQRNRERRLEVGLAELAVCADAPLITIAKKAGVGQGTFYRNFPKREALGLEIYRHEMQQVAD